MPLGQQISVCFVTLEKKMQMRCLIFRDLKEWGSVNLMIQRPSIHDKVLIVGFFLFLFWLLMYFEKY